MRTLLPCLLTGCAAGPAVVTALDVGDGAVAVAEDGRTGTLGVADGVRMSGDWSDIQVVNSTACALEAGGRPDCWQVGSDTLLSSVPAGPFDTFSVADGRAVFVFADGSLMHWPQVEHELPTQGPWVSVAAVGAYETVHPGLCGVDDAGALWCGEATEAAPGGPWNQVSRSGALVCALDSAGAITCFTVAGGAWAEAGALEGPFVSLDTGAAGGVCGRGSDGALQCEGLGDGAADWAALVPTGSGYDAIALSSDATWGCAIRGGEPVCFGKAGAVPDGGWSW